MSFLCAVLIALGLYTTILKLDNLRLSTRNVTLEQAEKRRVELAAAALRDNAAKEATDKQRTKQIEVEYARSKKTIAALHADNLRLLADIERLRHGSGGNPMPENPANPPIGIDGDTPIVSGDGTRLLIDLARKADEVRGSLMACQAYIRGL